MHAAQGYSGDRFEIILNDAICRFVCNFLVLFCIHSLNCVGVASQTLILRANAAAAAEVQRWTLMTPMVMQNLTSSLDSQISF